MSAALKFSVGFLSWWFLCHRSKVIRWVPGGVKSQLRFSIEKRPNRFDRNKTKPPAFEFQKQKRKNLEMCIEVVFVHHVSKFKRFVNSFEDNMFEIHINTWIKPCSMHTAYMLPVSTFNVQSIRNGREKKILTINECPRTIIILIQSGPNDFNFPMIFNI